MTRASVTLVGNSFSAADIQMSFVLESARPTGALESFQSFPNLGAYLERLATQGVHFAFMHTITLGNVTFPEQVLPPQWPGSTNAWG